MPELRFTRRFLRELAEWEGTASERDVEILDELLARIADQPALPGRFPSFYDPQRPSYLYRARSLLIHYRTTDDGHVEFLNLFFRRI